MQQTQSHTEAFDSSGNPIKRAAVYSSGSGAFMASTEDWSMD